MARMRFCCEIEDTVDKTLNLFYVRFLEKTAANSAPSQNELGECFEGREAGLERNVATEKITSIKPVSLFISHASYIT